MPKVTLTQENKQQQNNLYPKLTLEHGERALIVCIESDPTVAYRHILEAPEIGPDGAVIKEEAYKADGSAYLRTKKEFIGQHLCFGDFSTMSDKGADINGCPTCAAAAEQEGIAPAKPHYAMHVIKYALQPGGFNLRDPFNAECLAWVFSPTRLNTLIDIASELEDGDDIRKHDLRLGPCENKNFQKYDIHITTGTAQWLKSDERKQFVAQTYANNQSDDLDALIARRVTKSQALEDIQKVTQRYAELNNPGRSTQVPDLSNLQSQQKPAESAPDVETATLPADLFKPATPTEQASEATFSDPVSQPATQQGLNTMDFAELMKELG